MTSDLGLLPRRLDSPVESKIGVGVRIRDDEYEEFVRTRSHALLRSAYLLTGDQFLAEDLVQEALARAHRGWPRLRDSGNAEAYTRKVMYHLQVSAWRRRKTPEVLTADTVEPAGTGSDLAESAVQRVTLTHALRILSPKQRAVIVLRYFDDHSETAAADLLGMTVSTFRTHTARALDRLRTLVPELHELPAAGGKGR